METFPATLFDYNGVLIDDEAVHLAAFREVLAQHGVAVDEAAYWSRYIGFDDRGAFDAILTDQGREADPSWVASLVESKRPIYMRLARGQLKGFAGASALIQRRRSHGPACVVSGALRDEIRLGLEFLGVNQFIDGVIAAEDTSRSKPDPEGYALGLRMLEKWLPPALAKRALVIEDSVAGVQAAKALDLFCVAVTHSYQASELERAGADRVFDNLGELTDEALAALYRAVYS